MSAYWSTSDDVYGSGSNFDGKSPVSQLFWWSCSLQMEYINKSFVWHYSPVGYPCLLDILDMLPNFGASFRYSNRHWSDKKLRMRPRLHFGSDLAMGSGWMWFSYGKNEKNGKMWCLAGNEGMIHNH